MFGRGIHYTDVKALVTMPPPMKTITLKPVGAALTYVWLPTQLLTNERKHQHIAQWCVAEVQQILRQGDFNASDIALLVRGAG